MRRSRCFLCVGPDQCLEKAVGDNTTLLQTVAEIKGSFSSCKRISSHEMVGCQKKEKWWVSKTELNLAYYWICRRLNSLLSRDPNSVDMWVPQTFVRGHCKWLPISIPWCDRRPQGDHDRPPGLGPTEDATDLLFHELEPWEWEHWL